MCQIPIPCTERPWRLFSHPELSLLNVGTWFSEHCSTKGVDLLGPHWNGPVDKAQGFGQLERGKCWVLAARQSLLASAGSTYSLKGCWPHPALQRYGFSNLPPGQGKGQQYFGEVKSGCDIKPFIRQASASSEAPYGLLPPPLLGKTTSHLEKASSMWGQPGVACLLKM